MTTEEEVPSEDLHGTEMVRAADPVVDLVGGGGRSCCSESYKASGSCG